MDLQVLISTTKPNSDDFDHLKFDKLIISQNSTGIDKEEDQLRFFSFDERGLSKSRNRAIHLATGTHAFIADDDLVYAKDFKRKIEKAFSEFPEADIITFKIETPEGLPYKNYSNQSFEHSRTSIFKVSSVEIVLKLNTIKKHQLKFDENFGLGSTFTSGEETIFLNDAMNAGLRIYYCPEALVIHPLESSGKVLDETFFISKGALIKRLYRRSLYFFIGLIFLVKQLAKSQNTLTLSASIKAIFKGYKSI